MLGLHGGIFLVSVKESNHMTARSTACSGRASVDLAAGNFPERGRPSKGFKLEIRIIGIGLSFAFQFDKVRPFSFSSPSPGSNLPWSALNITKHLRKDILLYPQTDPMLFFKSFADFPHKFALLYRAEAPWLSPDNVSHDAHTHTHSIRLHWLSPVCFTIGNRFREIGNVCCDFSGAPLPAGADHDPGRVTVPVVSFQQCGYQPYINILPHRLPLIKPTCNKKLYFHKKDIPK